MNYLIAVLSDRIKAEAAYTALEKAGISTGQLTILGKGYKSADEFGLIDPNEQAKKRAILMAYWLVPFGFVAGYLFNLITGLDTFDWAGNPGNHILGGLAGAIGGAMGSFLSVVVRVYHSEVVMPSLIAIASMQGNIFSWFKVPKRLKIEQQLFCGNSSRKVYKDIKKSK